MRWRGSFRAWGWVVVSGALLALGAGWVTWWLLERTRGVDGPGVASVLALLPAVLSLVVGTVSAVAAVRSIPRADDLLALAASARALLRAVATDEAAALARLLGDAGRPRPASVSFARQKSADLPCRDDGGADCGTLDDVVGYYDSLVLGRLVVLGPAGAGKTVLVLRLLLDLASAALETDRTARVRVPVRMSLSSFPADGEPVAPAVARAALDSWIAGHLERTYDIRSAMAAALVADGWILPILDGLDELDTDTTLSQRARAVIDALNHPVGPDPGPLVITCRQEHYRGLAGPGIQDATMVTVLPLDVLQVVNWLAHRFPDRTRPNIAHPRWRRVITRIKQNPRGRLATCLASPLNLYLACAVYEDRNSTPGELCDLDQTALESHLLEHLVPALTRHHPLADGRRYKPQKVTRWLRTLADHLAVMDRAGLSGTDLHFHHLWRTATRGDGWPIRWAAVILSLLAMVSVPFVMVLVLRVVLPSDTPDDDASRETVRHSGSGGVADWLGYLVLAALLGALVFALARPRLRKAPRTWRPLSLSTSHTRKELAASVAKAVRVAVSTYLSFAALLALLLALFNDRFQRDPVKALVEMGAAACVLGVAVGAPLGVIRRLVSRGGENYEGFHRPSDAIRRSVVGDLVFGAAIGIGVGFGLGVAFGIGDSVVSGLIWGLVFGLTTFAILFLHGGGAYPWLFRYALTIAILHGSGRAPKRFGEWLDWAHTVGLLRLSGNATQFRHRDLQRYFRQ